MTGTAQSVKYHVSDCLQDRHPYHLESSFAAQRVRDKGKVYDGLLPGGVDTLLAAIADPSVEVVQKAAAMKHLLAHSAAAEKKIVLLRKGIVPRVAQLLESEPAVPIESLSMQLLRSLAVLPQGAFCVLNEGGLKHVLGTLRNRKDASEREEGRTSAASALQLITGCWASRAYLLGMATPPDLQLQGYDTPTMDERTAEETSQTVSDVLVSVLEQDENYARLTNFAAASIAQLTLERAGLQRCLVSAALRACSRLLERYTKLDEWLYADTPVACETVMHGATAVWHLAIHEVGKNEAVELPFIQLVGRLVALVLPLKERHFMLKAALAGAACSLTMHPALKKQAIEPIDSGADTTLLGLMLRLLKDVNDVYDPIYAAQKHGKPNPMPGVKLEQVAGVVKNCVQAVRLIVELPAARDVLQEQLGDRPETYNLRRQLFYKTANMQRFGVVAV